MNHNDNIIQAISDFIFIENRPERADAIIVTGGSFPEAAETAAVLWKNSFAPYILIGGGYSVKRNAFPGPRSKQDVYSNQYKTEYDFYKDVLLRNGVNETAILGEDRSAFTRENAVFAREAAEQAGLKLNKALLVCKSFHARRCLLFFQSAFPDTTFLIIPFAGFDITKENWFQTEYGTQRVLGELQRCGSQLHFSDIRTYAEQAVSRPYPDRAQADGLLAEAAAHHPGPWVQHSRIAARCAEAVAACCGMDTDKAYVFGLLHDIGRRFGKGHFQHIVDGYDYMLSLGYTDVARICLTHSFPNQSLSEYIGRFDKPEQDISRMDIALHQIVYNDYDRLIQLCDCVAGTDGPVDMQSRMEDVKQRYGSYPAEKWTQNLKLKAYFEQRCGADLHQVIKQFPTPPDDGTC